MDTNVYIDGFNLYYGLLKRSPYKWLDLQKFCDTLLPRNRVRRILYFTARVEARPPDLDQPARQAAYLRALGTLPRVEIHYGTFLSSVIRQPLVETDPSTGDWRRFNGKPVLQQTATGRPKTDFVLKTEEKASDVNLASHLLRDAFRGDCRCAVVISNDSDLLTPVRMAKEDCGLTLGLVLPRPKGSLQLKTLADFEISVRRHHLERSQFPVEIFDRSGTIHKPRSWD